MTDAREKAEEIYCSVMLQNKRYEAQLAIIEAGLLSARRAAIEEAKTIYRSLHSGGCRMLSQGDACECFLCQMDQVKQ